jgi:hypothetical protein
MTTPAREEEVVRAFLAPLSTIEPVRRPSRPSEPEPGPARHYLRYAAIAVAAALLVAAIAVIAHPRKAEKPAKHHVDAGIFAKTHGWITLGGQQVIALNPANPTQTRMLSRSPGQPIAWSRDGSKLLVTGPRGFGVLHANGSWTRVGGGSASGGSFTPDGSQVIYADNGTIWSVPSTGGKRKAITRGWVGTGAQLSPDGGSIVYRPGWTTPATIAIALMDSNGNNQRRLVSYPQVVKFMGYRNWRHSNINDISALAWLGDGTGVVLIALDQRATHCGVFAVNTDGSNLRRWGPPGFCPIRGALSRDGQHLAFTGSVGRGSGVVITNNHGDVTRSIRLPRSQSHPILAWQP